MNRNYKTREDNRVFITTQNVIHTKHSLKRWNESGRLDNYPNFNSITDANNYIKNIFRSKKIRHLYKNFYLLDNDIVAVLDVKKDKVTVITYYGSRTKTPSLYNLRYYIKNKHKYGNILLSA
ncbi:hypothetical protein [Senegalia massiliensis]|uniref:Uncharacterized protein n=1 Tax=Senegalia massiliensis TaxID=1720316 RepID=A0A845QZ24_9CLOT|nr:hypothetical protein [Senegalia massiliensis]NBI07551.1 hypothetical protein [Senegalia massiliensis]